MENKTKSRYFRGLAGGLLLLCICACNNQKSLENYSDFGNEKLVSTLKLSRPQTHVFLTDYYPALISADSVTCTDKEFTLVPGKTDWSEIDLYVDSTYINIGELKVWRGGKYLSIIAQVGDNTQSATIYSKSFDAKKINIECTQKPENIVAVWQNRVLPQTFVTEVDNGFSIEIPREAKKMQRSYIRVFACNATSQFNDILIPLENGAVVTDVAKLNRHDAQTQIMYQVMVDRFLNGKTENDRKLNNPQVLDKVDYQGGDLVGITKKINDGFFTELGISTLWISPIYQNPYDAWGQFLDPKTKFSGYHGYWPIYITKVDTRFGTEDELRALIDAAHAKGINVILDYVANHLHVKSPTIVEHPDWITDSITRDGRRNFELWDGEYRLTTWFDKHLASLNLGRPDVCEAMTDSALFWLANYDIDGFRHDACKHVPELYWRMLVQKMKKRFPERNVYQIGETYGSPELIGSYVKSGMLDAQFDFNVYDDFVRSIIHAYGSFMKVDTTLQQSLNAYGYHNLMGYITGNHDRPRFISLAGGAVDENEDTKTAGWKRNIGVGDPLSYSKLSLLEAFIFTIPGVPCIYYGDEYGVPGANDPDNRRMMQFDNYNARQAQTRARVEKLAQIRRTSMPLLYGDYVPLFADQDVLAFARIYMGKTVVVVLNKSAQEKAVSINSPLLNGKVEILFNENEKSTATLENGKLLLTQQPLSFSIYEIQ